MINDPTYADLLSSGNIDLIKKEDFKDDLIQYYHELELTEKVIENNNSYLVDQQFGLTFIELGYYFSNLVNDKVTPAAKVKSLQLTAIYNKEPSKISTDLLLKPENKLRLMNVINIRHTVSLGHLVLMYSSKERTEKLLEELNEIIHDKTL